jgi:hypothetical protein
MPSFIAQRPRVLGAAAAILALLAALLTGLAVGQVAKAPPSGAAPAAALAAVPASNMVRGLMDRQDNVPASSHRAAIRNMVIDVPWSSVEPSNNSFNWSEIDQELAAAKAAGMRASLQIEAGKRAPEWAKARSGGAVTMYATGDFPETFTVARFWTPNFLADYKDLMTKANARYGTDPAFGWVENTLCTTQFPEPYLRQTGDTRTIVNLRAAGFTDDLDQACHRNSWRATADAWPLMRVREAFNPYQHIRDDGTKFQDTAYTLAKIDQFRAALGCRAVLGNDSLHQDKFSQSGYPEIYGKIKGLGAPIALQTAVYSKVTDFRKTLQIAVDLGANAVELPYGYLNWPAAELKAYADKLVANPVPVCTV